jgi:hypothetical protein
MWLGILAWVSSAWAQDVSVARTYAMRQTFTSQMRDPNPFAQAEWRSTRTNTWALVQWKQTGTRVEYTEVTCGVETDKVFGAETRYPPAFVRGVDVRHRTATLSAASGAGTFRAGPYVQTFGVKLADPFRDELPTTEGDPRIVDTDGDGQPGMTVEIYHPLVGTGHVYVAQRSVARLEGQIDAAGVVRGVVYTAPDMFRVGADRWWLKADAPQRPHPDPAQSPFVMMPVEASTTCAGVLANRAVLFGR